MDPKLDPSELLNRVGIILKRIVVQSKRPTSNFVPLLFDPTIQVISDMRNSL